METAILYNVAAKLKCNLQLSPIIDRKECKMKRILCSLFQTRNRSGRNPFGSIQYLLLIGAVCSMVLTSCEPPKELGELALYLLCSDGIQNGDETGVDCGGRCAEYHELICLPGFADLHTHPATHLAFGGPTDGSGEGLLWGRPFNTTNQDITDDLPQCPNDKHSGFTVDWVQDRTRQEIIKTLDLFGQHQFHHTQDGPPSYSSWPHALSVSHQQMHVDWIRRAWEGGLRLLVASATDSEVLEMLWHRSYGQGASTPQDGFDRASAERQLDAIRQMVDQNSDWMQIVETSTEARNVILSGKLAVVLGLEMDQLSVDDMLDLWDSHKVRLVTPIHLVNNSFGGTAIYEPAFNTANEWLNGSFFDVQEDSKLEFRLHPEQQQIQFNNFPVGEWDPVTDFFSWGSAQPVDMEEVYPSCSKSGAGPSSYSNGNTLAMAWRGTNAPGRLRWVRKTESGWQKSFINDWAGTARKSNHAPSIAFFNDRWYVAWTGTNPDHPYIHIMRTTDASGNTWTDHQRLDGSDGRPSVKSSRNPFLLAANGRLSLFWVGTKCPGQLRWVSTTDGVNWGSKRVINDGRTRQSCYAPAAAYFNNRYYIAWTGTNKSHPYIHLLRSNDANGTSWGSHKRFDGNNNLPQAMSSEGPAISAANGQLHIAWTGTNKRRMRWIRSSNGTSWHSKQFIQDWRERRSAHAPSLVFHQGQYFTFWTGTNPQHPYVHSLKTPDNGTQRWIHHQKNVGCPGHRNALGLINEQQILDLMNKGFLIDIAHMSQAATEDILKLARKQKYPLMSSHTEIRGETDFTFSEREMSRKHAMWLRGLAGVIGFGTGWNPDTDRPIEDWVNRYEEVCDYFGYPAALGTDFNGLSCQIPNSEQSISYPFVGFENRSTPRLELGQRNFNLTTDGLANYGMLPDFLEAVASKDPTAADNILSSAQVAVNMWRRVEMARDLMSQ